MADTIMCISGAALAKAGTNVSTDLSNGTLIINGIFSVDTWIQEAESTINDTARYNFSDNFGSLNPDTKYILRDIAASLAAIQCIIYDMSGYTTRGEAEDLININRDAALRGLSIIRDTKTQDFINGA